jgi:glutamate 5-kinase
MSDSSRRIVVKCGTRLVTKPTGLNDVFISDIARQIAEVRETGTQVALVTSGAVAAGRTIAPMSGDALVTRQVLAAVGQAPLMTQYAAKFGDEGILVAQALLSRADLVHRSGYLNARNALNGLLDEDILPVANENDVVATEELRFGDNDVLSVLIAKLIGADRLCILSSVGGLYTGDPSQDPMAELITEAGDLPREDLERIAGDASEGGSGGMRSKLQAAFEAVTDGIDVVIADGNEANVLVRVERGESLGTHLSARGPIRSSRDRWISSNLGQRGEIVVDSGAKHAVVRDGRSLLPAGITQIKGGFERGDLVGLLDPHHEVFARGLVNYGSDNLGHILGLPSAGILSTLGFSYGDEVVHRNNLVLIDRFGEKNDYGRSVR